MKSIYTRASWFYKTNIVYKSFLIISLFFLSSVTSMGQSKVYKSSNGTISFRSEAPLEVITATSKKLEGIIDINALSFAFAVPIRTFDGFNNGLQRQHFYENYMETDKHPTATFSGKIIERVDLSVPGTYTIRAKGQLIIHGHAKERILKIEVVSDEKEIKAVATFFVSLADHQIEVPRIVNQKIAKEIEVKVRVVLATDNKS